MFEFLRTKHSAVCDSIMIRSFLRNLMVGRYGPDHLGVAMIFLSLILTMVHLLVNFLINSFPVLLVISYLVAGLAFYRILSKNISRRRSENDKFIRYWWPIMTKTKNFISKQKQRKTFKFFKCPSCRNNLRVPRGKGKIYVTCPKCGERFTKKT